jgi:hypothetical protein
MDDTEYLKVKKDLLWNIGMYLVAFAMLAIGWHFGLRLLDKGESFKESLQIMTLATVIPAFFLMVAWNRLSQETVGVILATVLGFALGKIV